MWMKDPFAGSEEIVAVDKGIEGLHRCTDEMLGKGKVVILSGGRACEAAVEGS